MCMHIDFYGLEATRNSFRAYTLEPKKQYKCSLIQSGPKRQREQWSIVEKLTTPS
jgi:hypothetical protein